MAALEADTDGDGDRIMGMAVADSADTVVDTMAGIAGN